MANMLSKYGVPLPSGGNKTMLQPKAKYKFRVVVYNFGTDNNERDYIALDVDKVDRPSISFSTHKVFQFNTNSTYIGSHDWNPINLTIRDSIGNQSAKALSRQLQKQLDFQRRLTPRDDQLNAGYKFGVIIQMLNGRNADDTITNLTHNTIVSSATAITNNSALVNSVDSLIGGNSYNSSGILEYFICTGCVISDINYDSLDYSSSDPVTMTITIKPDNVTQFDSITNMYAESITSLFDDDTNTALNIIDQLFGSTVI